jgi:outer membrane immunogenic protein
MFKKLALASTLLTSLTGLAAAADLPSRMAPPVYAPPPLPIFTWSGFYAGINAGYAFDYSTRFRSVYNPTGALGSSRLNDDGVTAGGQIGYNYQFGAGSGIVVGLEADAAWTDLGRTRGYDLGGGFAGGLHSSLDYLGTVRGRLGYAFGQFLVYGTGGFAYGNVSNRFAVTDGLTSNYDASRSRTQTGYTYGGGVEYALPTNTFLNFFHSSAVTLKVEYLHYDLGSTNIYAPNLVAGAAAGDSYNVRAKTDGDLVRAGLNYKF